LNITAIVNFNHPQIFAKQTYICIPGDLTAEGTRQLKGILVDLNFIA
jgi:hypothetical protein